MVDPAELLGQKPKTYSARWKWLSQVCSIDSRKGWRKTAQLFNVRSWFGEKVDQSFLDKLESRLIQADVGVEATSKIVERVRVAFSDKTADENLLTFVKDELKTLLADPRPGSLLVASKRPSVYLVAGVNGSGKTTSIAKLSQRLKDEGKTLLLGACDTFRAAAAEQLAIWATRAGCEIVRGAPGADPASVAHDACQRALARNVDVLIVDTAGRLHTQTHLMRELEKIRNVVQRLIPGAPHEVLLVIDATNGQNAIRQAEAFSKTIGCTGVILTKLDGTAKGGRGRGRSPEARSAREVHRRRRRAGRPATVRRRYLRRVAVRVISLAISRRDRCLRLIATAILLGEAVGDLVNDTVVAVSTPKSAASASSSFASLRQ